MLSGGKDVVIRAQDESDALHWVFVLTIAISGCDSQSTAHPQQGGIPTSGLTSPSMDKTEADSMRKLSLESSRFIPEIGRVIHPEVDSATSPGQIRFDFSGHKVYTFDYSHYIEGLGDFGVASQPTGRMKQVLKSDGLLILSSSGNGTGVLTVRDLTGSISITTENNDVQTIPWSPPPVSLPGIREDGSIRAMGSNVQPLLGLLFPIPSLSLVQGESVRVPFSLPYNAVGINIQIKGSSTIKLTRIVLIDGRSCAQLEMESKTTQVDVPSGAAGKYDFLINSKGIYFFDIEAKEFVSGETAALSALSFKQVSANPKVLGPVDLFMKSDNLIRITRNVERAK